MTDVQINTPKEQTGQMFKGLEWLVDEIERNLTSAFNDLEAFTKDTSDQTKINFCLAHIHQISGPFKILQCQGLILLAEEMEALTQSIIDKQVSNTAEACEILVQVIIRLPIYLRQVLVTRIDQPESIMLLLNDLRAAQGRGLVSEGMLFSPDLSALENKSEKGLSLNSNPDAFVELVKRLRQIYQISLIKLIKDEQLHKHHANLKKVFQRMQELCAGTWRQDLWKIAEQVLGLVATRRIDFTMALKKLFRGLDTQLKLTLSDAASSSAGTVDIALVKNLLYYLMVVKAETDEQKELWEIYKLAIALPAGVLDPDSNRLTPHYDPAVVRSLVAAIQGELRTVRSALEQFTLEGGLSSEDVSKTLPILGNMADSLALVGQGKLRDAISSIEKNLKQTFSPERGNSSPERNVDSPKRNANSPERAINDEEIIESVQRLTEVDAMLSAWAAHPEKFRDEIQLDDNQNMHQLETAKEALLAEARTGFERIKETVVEFINSQWDQDLIKSLPGNFYELSGALKIIELKRAASIVDGCGIYVQQNLINCGAVIEWKLLDAFADTITTVEYYLEQVASITDADQDRILDGAEEKIDMLLASTLEEPLDGKEGAMATEPLVESTQTSHPDSIAKGASSTASQHPVSTQDNNVQPSTDIDDEIIEIFLEEAQEVLDTLHKTVPLWEKTPEATEPLTVIRRSFHTLKGSGRMVGAVDIGELAWSVESMLNRILDGRISTSKSHIKLVEQTLERFPVLITAFEKRESQPSPIMTQQIIHHAEQLARDEVLTELPVPSAFSEPNESGEPDDANEPSVTTDLEMVDVLGAGKIVAEESPTVEPSDNHEVVLEDSLLENSVIEDIQVIDNMTPVASVADLSLSDFNEVEMDEPALDASTSEDENQKSPVIRADLEAGAKDEEESEETIILAIFVNEAKSHLRAIDHYLIQARALGPLRQPPTSVLQRSLHTLKGTSDMAGFGALSRLVTPLYGFIKELLNHQVAVDDDIIYLINDGVTFFRDLLGQMEEQQDSNCALQEPDGLPLFYQRIEELREKYVGALLQANGEIETPIDIDAVKNLMAYGLFALEDYAHILQELREQDETDKTQYQKFIADLEAIIDTTVLEPIAELSAVLLAIYKKYYDGGLTISPQDFPLLEVSHETLLSLFDMLAADQDFPSSTELDFQALNDLLTEIPSSTELTKEPSAPVEGIENPSASSDVIEEPSAPSEATENPPVENSEFDAILLGLGSGEADSPNDESRVVSTAPSWLEQDIDTEIAGVFVEEAEDIVSHLEETLHAWQKAPKGEEFADRLKRDLHTLKGGARMAGFNGMGQYAHEFESVIDGAENHDDAFFVSLSGQLERIIGSYDIAREVAAGRSRDQVEEQISAFLAGNQSIDSDATDGDLADLTSEESNLAQPETGEPETGEPKTDGLEEAEQSKSKANTPIKKVTAKESQATFERTAGSQVQVKEVVRIGSETLDTLVNLSGENIIFRGRVEEQVSEFNHSLEEMDATIIRLQEQVRRLGTETEAQIDYRREQIQASGESANFDPLEMDRYSHLQQLSGSLVESASDLYDLKETLVDKLLGTESLLIHQSRINIDLQEGLMQTRMVPFSRVVPRLRRIVRQVGLELGKDVQLSVDNVQGEMDRTVLDRMVAPLEHMIRNAIDHGIESKKDRKSSDKPKVGKIAISTYRQGGDIVIHLADDGAGLDMERIKSLAIEKDLMHENALLSDHEIAQFIFHPGFTTLDSVSEISGRGVGMDVVSSEVRQLGGSVDIESSPGKGTRFTVVLPFTLAVNRALMINVSGDHYALSLNSIDGVHFITPEKLSAAISSKGMISYGGKEYELQHLGSLLNKDVEQRVDKLSDSVGLVLFHSDNRHFAAQVDEIIGTQEIVVKSLGAQFSKVPGLGGATILSDGRVVVIIDLNELARVAISDGELLSTSTSAVEDQTVEGLPIKGLPVKEKREVAVTGDNLAPYVLVVDDSVTVRKVTSRILIRQGYRVGTAKDGVEALKEMQEQIPDVMLLDIEMPNMDGFEVASRVRASGALKNIPIIMITSRTGDKHRQRAMELGVNEYMGKPYQEDHLLATIDQMLLLGSAEREGS